VLVAGDQMTIPPACSGCSGDRCQCVNDERVGGGHLFLVWRLPVRRVGHHPSQGLQKRVLVQIGADHQRLLGDRRGQRQRCATGQQRTAQILDFIAARAHFGTFLSEIGAGDDLEHVRPAYLQAQFTPARSRHQQRRSTLGLPPLSQ